MERNKLVRLLIFTYLGVFFIVPVVLLFFNIYIENGREEEPTIFKYIQTVLVNSNKPHFDIIFGVLEAIPPFTFLYLEKENENERIEKKYLIMFVFCGISFVSAVANLYIYDTENIELIENLHEGEEFVNRSVQISKTLIRTQLIYLGIILGFKRK